MGIPNLIRAKIPQRRFGRALDLGCGTGLAGKSLRGLCDFLEGVDLSGNMVAKAEECGLYDELHCRDLVAHLRRQKAESFDLLISADVLPYVLSLEQLFREARRVVAASGVFAFSTESADEAEAGTAGFVERSSERLAHARCFVVGLAEGFDVESVEEVPVRLDGADGTIMGDLFVLRRRSE